MAAETIRWFSPFAVVGWWDTAVGPAARGGCPVGAAWVMVDGSYPTNYATGRLICSDIHRSIAEHFLDLF